MPRFSDPGRRVLQCRNTTCSLQFLFPQPSPSELQALYASLYYQGDSSNTPHRYSSTPDSVSGQIGRALQQHLGTLAGCCLLDFGAGSGGFASVMRQMGAQVVCVEPDSEARRQLDRKDLPCFPSLEALLVATPDARFAIVTAIEVLEHLVDPVRYLRELLCILEPGGHLFLSTPNFRSLRALIQGSAWEQYRNPTHLFYFTRTSLRRALLEAGFASCVCLRTAVHYPTHGPVRSVVQRSLQRAGLDADLWALATGEQARDTEA